MAEQTVGSLSIEPVKRRFLPEVAWDSGLPSWKHGGEEKDDFERTAQLTREILEDLRLTERACPLFNRLRASARRRDFRQCWGRPSLGASPQLPPETDRASGRPGRSGSTPNPMAWKWDRPTRCRNREESCDLRPLRAAKRSRRTIGVT
jgi:hypothetical protein